VIARRAFERPDVEANRAGGNPRQHGSRLADGAEWSLDGHNAIAFGSGGSVTELSVTGSCRGGGDAASMEPSRSRPLVNLAHFPKVNVLVEANSNWEAPTQAALVSEQCCLEKLGKLEAANAALLF
jgi:hypothetical protein